MQDGMQDGMQATFVKSQLANRLYGYKRYLSLL